MLVSYAVRIDVQCDACAIPIVVAGAASEVRCPACEAVTELGDDFLPDALTYLIDTRRELTPPQFTGRCGLSYGVRIRAAYGLDAPCCDRAGCGRELPLALLETAAAQAPGTGPLTIHCPACRTPTTARRLDPPRAMGHSLARFLLLEHRAAPRLTGALGGGTVCVWCPTGCGEANGLTEYEPEVTCHSCEVTSPLDRAMFDRIAKLPGEKYFYVVIEDKAARSAATPPPPETFPLKLGWVTSATMVAPVVILGVLGFLAWATLNARALPIVIALGVIAAIRIVQGLHTLLRDRHIVVGPETLHVPVVGLTQLAPWNLPLTDVVAMSSARKSGGSTRLIVASRDGTVRSIAAEVVSDRAALMRAVEERASPLLPDPGR